MNTEQESKRFHNGIYQGLKDGLRRRNPLKVKEDVRAFDKSFTEWYGNDDHYYDVPYMVTYLGSNVALIAVLGFAATQLGVPVTELATLL